MIASLKVGYMTRMLSGLLDIFDAKGGYKRARVKWMRQRAGCRDLLYGGKATLLDTIYILKVIWDTDGKYARSAEILGCWQKASIAVGYALVPMNDKTLSVNDCEELCGLFAKYHASARVVAVKDGLNGLAGLFAEHPSPFGQDNWRQMANACAFTEDDPLVQDLMVNKELGIDGDSPVDEDAGDEGPGEIHEEVEVMEVEQEPMNNGCARKDMYGSQLISVDECIE